MMFIPFKGVWFHVKHDADLMLRSGACSRVKLDSAFFFGVFSTISTENNLWFDWYCGEFHNINALWNGKGMNNEGN